MRTVESNPIFFPSRAFVGKIAMPCVGRYENLISFFDFHTFIGRRKEYTFSFSDVKLYKYGQKSAFGWVESKFCGMSAYWRITFIVWVNYSRAYSLYCETPVVVMTAVYDVFEVVSRNVFHNDASCITKKRKKNGY